MTNDVELEILNYSFWEHFKKAKDLALILPIKHPKRLAIEKEISILQEKIKDLNDNRNIPT